MGPQKLLSAEASPKDEDDRNFITVHLKVFRVVNLTKGAHRLLKIVNALGPPARQKRRVPRVWDVGIGIYRPVSEVKKKGRN